MSDDYLNPDSIEWALTHLKRYGDTDIFPIPFEYEAFSYDWPSFKPQIESMELSKYQTRPFQRYLIPKQYGGYRPAIQLDPLDSIIYTALAFESADLIENSRIPIDQKIACSYRVEIGSQGKFFRENNGWDDYLNYSREISYSGHYRYVVTADIVDFYNQISHHRIQNALEKAEVEKTRADNIEGFLTKLTKGQSRGIPVGPMASIIFSEACLNDVDHFLTHNDYIHTRYVDDFRIFCKTKENANKALHDLIDYLHTTHRFALQTHKTKIWDVDEFASNNLSDPEEIEMSSLEEKVNRFLSVTASPYSEAIPIDDSLLDNFNRDILIELFNACLNHDPLHYGLAKHLLRRATALKTVVLMDQVLQNIDKLIPITREVSKYIKATTKPEEREVGLKLISGYRKSDFLFLPYIQMWILDVLISKMPVTMSKEIIELCNYSDKQLGVRPLALLAMKLNRDDWLRSQKETWQNNKPWDKRAIIWACQSLPSDELNAWITKIRDTDDVLDKTIAKATKHKKNNDMQKEKKLDS